MKNTKTTAFGWMATLLLALFLLPGMKAKADSGYEKTLLWEVSGNGLAKPSHLFGTFHLLKEGHLESLDKVRTAFENADGVVVEIVMDSIEMMQSLSAMFMPDNSLKNLYKAKTYKKLAEKFEEVTGQPLAMLNQLKPNAAMLQLVAVYTAAAVGDAAGAEGMPIDAYVAVRGAELGKTVHPLETLAKQMDVLMNSASLEEQAKALEWTIKNLDEVEASQKLLAESYMDQDLDGLESLLTQFPQLSDLGMGMEDLLDKRNDDWMTQLPDLMEQGSQFVAVGALHLVGETGLIEQLRAQGYTVTPILD